MIFILIWAIEAAMAAVLFGSAGRLDLPWFWGLIAVHGTLLTIGVRSIDPGLREERLRPGPGGKGRRVRLAAVPFLLAHLVVAGLDVGRFGWSGSIPSAAHAAALAGYTAGMGLSIWAMAVNRYCSPVVRIQAERGHRVITVGPYRWLRHPGYAGMLVSAFCGGIVLGSWWSIVPLVPVVALFLHRTAMEDRFLRDGLEGYAGYAEAVRYRLVPGVW